MWLSVQSKKKVRTPQWYLLPKIHKIHQEKKMFDDHLIVSGCLGLTGPISVFLDFKSNQWPTYIKETTNFTRKIQQSQTSLFRCSVDVLQYITLHNEALTLMCQAFGTRQNKKKYQRHVTQNSHQQN